MGLKYNYNQVQFNMRNNLLEDYGFKDYKEFLESPFWKAMKATLRKKKQFQKCCCCGSEKDIELHHMKYQDFLDYSSKKNIIPTCRDCHEKIHQISRKFNISFKNAARRVRRANNYRHIDHPKPIKVRKIYIKKEKVKKEGNRRERKYLIVSNNSLPCPKCRQPMQCRSHRTTPTEQKVYYTQWDYCKKCMHVQHYEHYKIVN